ncbi:MAG TPA: M48 family metalloprotease [Thermoanaerobaculales bacterium]|nr:M48 family metalloprotease [Thermoanaerobaculales bacterium]HPA80619.1 M48 family metalloprotease [Thermoanaerobaculales bacterium]HQL30021.1 M48 family metalloprotease [Thermoanaerobaculales bacterium]
MRGLPMALIASLLAASCAAAAELPAIVHRPAVDVYAQPGFDAEKIATLKRDDKVAVSAQQGLWYELLMPEGKPGYVRVNDVRLEYAGTEGGGANMQALLSGKAGEGRVTETAGVRGIDESDLKSASFNAAQLKAMVGYRVNAPVAAGWAGEHGWPATTVAYADEAKGGKDAGKSSSSKGARAVGGGLGSMIGGGLGSAIGGASKLIPKSESELEEEELALGPEITGRILGARPLWNDADAQRRVNLVGRWVASQTSRPELPWTFGVIDAPEVNAFAAPGGFILVTRGLYEMVSSDSELAAALSHEITHCVQRDHYNVIRKQEAASAGKDVALSATDAGKDSLAGSYARSYAEKHGAAIMLTSLDRKAEFRADEGAEYYLARAGFNPLALYSLLQKLTALGTDSAALAQLYKTHPSFDARIDHIDERGFGALEPYTMREF